MNTFDYPIGADTADAPWNKEENTPVKAEMILSITISKMVSIDTSSYEKDKEGIDFDEQSVIDEYLDSGEYNEILDSLREGGWSIEESDLELY